MVIGWAAADGIVGFFKVVRFRETIADFRKSPGQFISGPSNSSGAHRIIPDDPADCVPKNIGRLLGKLTDSRNPFKDLKGVSGSLESSLSLAGDVSFPDLDEQLDRTRCTLRCAGRGPNYILIIFSRELSGIA